VELGQYPANVLAPIKPLPLTNGHGRYMTVTPERTLMSVGELPLQVAVKIYNPTFSIPKRLRNGRFNYGHLDPEVVKKSVGAPRKL
jgi:hypothetical protein